MNSNIFHTQYPSFLQGNHKDRYQKIINPFMPRCRSSRTSRIRGLFMFYCKRVFWCPQNWEKFNGREKFCRSENTLHEPREKDNQFNNFFHNTFWHPENRINMRYLKKVRP